MREMNMVKKQDKTGFLQVYCQRLFGGHPAGNLLLNNYLFAGKKKSSKFMGSGKSLLTAIGYGKEES